MPFTVILLLTRAPHLTPSQFKTYFETKHLPLVKQLFGPLTPVPKRRFYVAHDSPSTSTHATSTNISTNASASSTSSSLAQTYIPRLLKGDPSSVDFDCICELEWESEEMFKAFQGRLRERENMERVARDHEEFMGEERILMMGSVEGGMPEGWE